MSHKFPGMDMGTMVNQLNTRGKEFGITFNPWKRLSNSRQALQAGEFAKDHGAHDAMHEALFQSYFVEGRDIGQREVILDAARRAKLDIEALNNALEKQIYLPRLNEVSDQLHAKGITAAPTFEIDAKKRIAGAMPTETFRIVLRELLEGSPMSPMT